MESLFVNNSSLLVAIHRQLLVWVETSAVLISGPTHSKMVSSC